MTPLLGTRVVDFSHVIAGPFATLYLARLGAQVTKVEAPGNGDMLRSMRSETRAFETLNSGKDFVQLDIATDEGREQALRMAAQADVFVDNYRPGVLERHGLGYQEVRRARPEIIYCTISGYGRCDSPLAGRGAYDHVIQALTGMAMLAGREGDPPVKVGFPAVDTMTGVLAALAILAALQERDRTGQGGLLDVSMWGAALQLMYPLACDALNGGSALARQGNQGYSGSPAADIFPCRDGWLAVGANTGAQMGRLAEALRIPHAALAGLLAPLAERGAVLASPDTQGVKQLLREAMAQADCAELEERLNRAGVPAARVRNVHEFVEEFRTAGVLEPTQIDERGTLTPGLGWKWTARSDGHV